jgi:microcompartment protein CcmL/EutN
MKAIGMIETRGLIPAIESADAMLKAAEVTLIERRFVKGGLVTIIIAGDVAACKASVDAAASAVQRMGCEIISTHVIPRPHSTLSGLIVNRIPEDGEEIHPDDDEESHISSHGNVRKLKNFDGDDDEDDGPTEPFRKRPKKEPVVDEPKPESAAEETPAPEPVKEEAPAEEESEAESPEAEAPAEEGNDSIEIPDNLTREVLDQIVKEKGPGVVKEILSKKESLT